jgi:hypothetical protein
VFWQPPYVFATGSDNGLYVIEASDPLAPELVHVEEFDPLHRAAQVQVVGNLLMVTAAEGPRTVLLDVSDPELPQPIPGGDFDIVDGEGVIREAYFATLAGGYVWYAIKNNDGGLLAYDIRDPGNPTYAGHLDTGGNGGYVMVKGDRAFVGESTFAGIYDIGGLPEIDAIATLSLEGDLDTATPIGNVVVLSVDEDAAPGQGSAIVPYALDVDTDPPAVTWSWPPDGRQGMPLGSRIGVTFDEMVDVKSVFEGSVRLYQTGTEPGSTRVDGWVTAQEHIVNFVPREPLQPGTSYTFEIPAGGVADYNGNRIVAGFSLQFTTVGG